MQLKNRVHGLDVLRSCAIILVFMFHYMVFVSNKPTFGFLSTIGWVGVDLFFVLSGYLIGNQIFSALAKGQQFSLKIFYSRRLLRTLPNYLFILAMYFFISGFREHPVLPALWKFLTFTQNFNLQAGTAFSHAWSLCIEEQFYLILPIMALFLAAKKSLRIGWIVILALLLAGIALRSFLWVHYVYPAGKDFGMTYFSLIYYSSFCRLDELILGVAIALVRNFHTDLWIKITAKGNLILIAGVLATSLTFYLFLYDRFGLMMTAFGYPLLAISFAALTLAALSPNSWLYKMYVPGAATLAIWSYAIYLVHKPLSVLTYTIITKYKIMDSNLLTIFSITVITLIGGWLLYIFIETPFLKLRNKVGGFTPILTTSNNQMLAK